MAKLYTYTAFDIDVINFNYFIANLDHDVFHDDEDLGWEDSYHLATTTDDIFSVYGTGFGYDLSSNMTLGTIEALSQFEWNAAKGWWQQIFHLTDTNVSMSDFYDASQSPATADDRDFVAAAFAGDDRFILSRFADNASGFAGADIIKGRGGADTLFGNNGNDNINGGAGNDQISGGRGADEILGANGKDVLRGDQGADVLSGGAGADTFEFSTGDGIDRITDFKAAGAASDQIDLSGLATIKGWADLKNNHLKQVGDDVRINGLNNDRILLEDVQLSDLDQGDFLF